MKKIVFTFLVFVLLGITGIFSQGVSGVFISGIFKTGQTVSCYYTGDPGLLADPNYKFEWYRVTVGVDSVPLTEITENYKIVGDDETKKLLVKVIQYDGTTRIDSAYSPLSPTVFANSAPVANSPAISIPTNLNIGSTLIGTYTYYDAENDTEATSQFQWQISDDNINFADIGSATSNSYVILSGDAGKYLKFSVQPIASTGIPDGTWATSPSQGPVNSNAKPEAQNVGITVLSNLWVGSTLLGTYDYTDAENDIQGASTFQWSRASDEFGAYSNITEANGGTGIAYVIQMADTGKWFMFEVTPIAAAGTFDGDPVTGLTAAGPVNNAPYIENLSIAASGSAGTILDANYDFYDPDGDVDASEYKWLRNGVAIPGETGSSYVITTEDQGTGIKVRVLPVSASGYPNIGIADTSNACSVGISEIPLAYDVCISGNRVSGLKLTGVWKYDENGTGKDQGASYLQWIVNGAVVQEGSRYVSDMNKLTLTSGNVNENIVFRVVPKTKSSQIPGDTATSVAMTKITNTKTSFSVTEDSVLMKATPAIGTIPGASWTFSGSGINEIFGNFYFFPSDPSLNLSNSPFKITETVILDEGCTQRAYIDFSVSESSVFFDAGFKDFFCYEDVSATIGVIGLPPDYSTPGVFGYDILHPGYFIVWPTVPGAIISQTDKQIVINPRALGAGNGHVYLYYVYYETNGLNIVQYYIYRPFIVDFIGDNLSITNLPLKYCEDGEPFDIFGDNMTPAGGTGSWSSPIISSSTSLRATVNPSLKVGGGSEDITFTYTSPIGCQRPVTSSIYINPTPIAGFNLEDVCIEFPGDTTMFVNTSTYADSIEFWVWNFGDIFPTISYEENPGYLYKSEGKRDVTLIATTYEGCSDTLVRQIDVGVKPVAGFYWEKDCYHAGEDLLLFDNTYAESAIVKRRWLFDGAGEIIDVLNPTCLKTTPGYVDVEYYVETAYAECSDTVTKSVLIRPTIVLKDGTYFDDFDGSDTPWFTDSQANNSWVLGTPDRNYIKTAASGSNSWYTAFDTLNQVKANYAVESPCFDFTDVERPMIKFNLMKAFDKYRDGGALQFKIGDAPQWDHIGTLDDGINWYNSVLISGRPGGTQIGWTTIKEIDATWKEARHKLDRLTGSNDVKLRVVYGSDGTSQHNDGFAFDNIWIGERTRTVLIEHFTNNWSTLAATFNPDLNEITGRSVRDAVNIQYHTDYPGNDQFYSDNSADPSARALFYGLSRIPFTFFGGGTNKDFAKMYDYILAEVDSLDLNKRSMVDPYFNLTINAGVSGDVVTVSGNMTALGDLDEKNMTLYVAVVAKEITTVTGGNGETIFKNVLRKMLPTAAGTDLKKLWAKNDTQAFGDFSWIVSNTYDATEIEVIAFLQNNITKQVYQAATSGVSTITSLPYTVFEEQKFSVYPNPATDHIVVSFRDGLEEDAILMIYNGTGVKVRSEQLFRGDTQLTIDDLNLPDGMYIVRLEISGRPAGYRKLIVTGR